jgi:hypothetical protein
VNTNQARTTVCQHKPGEPWADGCCTSQSRSTETVVEEVYDRDSESISPQLSALTTAENPELPKELSESVPELDEEQNSSSKRIHPTSNPRRETPDAIRSARRLSIIFTLLRSRR